MKKIKKLLGVTFYGWPSIALGLVAGATGQVELAWVSLALNALVHVAMGIVEGHSGASQMEVSTAQLELGIGATLSGFIPGVVALATLNLLPLAIMAGGAYLFGMLLGEMSIKSWLKSKSMHESNSYMD